MADKLEKGINTYSASECQTASRSTAARNPVALLSVTLLYLVTLLSVPLDHLAALLWFGIYPLICSAYLGIPFSRIFVKSMAVIPFIALIGIFNPWFDRAPGIRMGGYELSHGWLTFISITVRGLYALQALLLLTSACGFIEMCRAMRRVHVPAFLTTQLEMVYRYGRLLLEELQQMRRARMARGYGRRSFSVGMWGPMIGQLFIRSIDRAQRVHQAMLCRGFRGTIPDWQQNPYRWSANDTAFTAVWILVFLLLRFLSPQLLFH